jgi:quinol monooxygenase YgiN
VSQVGILQLKDDKDIVHCLQNTTDLKATGDSFRGCIESYEVRQNLNKFTEERDCFRTPETHIDILRRQQLYLAETGGNLQYTEHVDKELVDMMTAAKKVDDTMDFFQLNKLTKVAESNGCLEHDVVRDLRNSSNLQEGFDNVLDRHQTHYIRKLEADLEYLAKTRNLDHDGKTFSEPAKYLDYLMDTRVESFAPIDKLKSIHDNQYDKLPKVQKEMTQEIEPEKPMQKSRGFEMEM